MNGTCTAVGED